RVMRHLHEWNFNDPDILELRMEDVSRSPVETMARVLGFFGLHEPGRQVPGFFLKGQVNRLCHKLGLPLLFKQKVIALKDIERIHARVSFRKLSKGRNTGEVDNRSHYRSGKTGDWKNHFTPAVKEKFKQAYGDIAVRLGYEADNNW